MSEESYLLEKKGISWIGRLFKVIFFFCAFFLIMAIVLFNMGGSNDTLKEHVESYLSQNFGGRSAKVGKLHNMSFFPRIGIDVEDTAILAKNEGSYPIIGIGRIQAYMSFWGVATRKPRFSHLYAENINVLKGILFPRELTIEKLYVDHDLEKGTAKLRAHGRLDIHPWSAQGDIKVFGSKGKYQYSLAGRFPVSVDIADIHFNAVIVNHEDKYFKLENFTLSNDDIAIKGNVTLFALARRMMKAKMEIELPSEDSSITSEILFDMTKVPHNYSGQINSEGLDLEDIAGERNILALFNRVYEIFGYANLSESGDLFKDVVLRGDKALDMTFDLKNVRISEEDKNALRFTIKKDSSMVKLGPVVNDKMRIPAIFMLEDKEAEGGYNIIIQDGQLDPNFAKHWIPNLPNAFMKQQNIDITCGIGKFTVGHNTLKFHDLVLKNTVRDITLSNQVVDGGALGDVNLKNAFRGTATLETIALEKAQYEFVQSSLQRSVKVSPCAEYIKLQEKKTPATQPDQEQE